MKIAVTYNNGEVFQHFGHSKQFKLYEVENYKILSSDIIYTDGKGHGALSGFLKENNVDVLICGGIGVGAKNALRDFNIELYPGVEGNADEQVEAFLAGNLSYNPNIKCSHHSHSNREHICENN